MFFEDNKTYDRQPAVAGRFYPADPDELKKQVISLLKTAKPQIVTNTAAIISPHAGYVFSGPVAASALIRSIQTETIKIFS